MRGVWRIRQWVSSLEHDLLLKRARVAVSRFPLITGKARSPLSVPLIVTLTSFPPRFPTLAATLKSLLDQRMRADRTILWIAHGDLKILPREVTDLVPYGLEIRGCKDLGSYKKLIPALTELPEACCVTADDDVYYHPDWLGNLVKCYSPSSKVIIASRAHLARFDATGKALPYQSWQLATHMTTSSEKFTAIFPTGVGGVLYPPNSLLPMVTNECAFRATCPFGDDIWFFWMARMNGFTHIRIPESFPLLEWPAVDGKGLYLENLYAGRNDTQIKSVEERFGPAISV